MVQRLVLLLILVAVVACGSVPQAGVSPEPTGIAAPSTSSGPEAMPSPTPLLTSTPKSRDVHQAEGAGRWYSDDPARLQATVEAYMDQAQVTPLPGRLLAVIVPHAGYVYSGAVAGHAFRALREAGCEGQTITVIGDTHTGNGSAEIAVWAQGAFETPLGSIPVDADVAGALLEAGGPPAGPIEFDRKAFREEHPVENQLPFLQVACPGARIVPVVIRQPSLQNAQYLADALVEALGEGSHLIVASTDLSHYHPYDEARQMDEVALDAIISLDPQAVADSPRRCAEQGLGGGDPTTMCSQGAVMTALAAAGQMGANLATVLDYANSGDVPIGDREQVVGYGAVALWQSEGGAGQPVAEAASFAQSGTQGTPDGSITLSPEAQEQLLDLARETARQYLMTETFPDFKTDDPALLQPMGAYVTYEVVDDVSGERALRGCLGRLEGDRPAYLNVQYAAVAAALADSRFPAVTPAELDQLALEITLLEPMHLASGPDEIEIGRDGVLMRVGQDGVALFLPQVPSDQGWDLADTLLNLCRKAELADDCWQRDDAWFYVFGGQWFGEED